MIGSNRAVRRAALASATAMCLALVTTACGDSSSSSSSEKATAAQSAGTNTSGGSAGLTRARERLARYSTNRATFTPPGPPLEGADVLRGKKVYFIPIFFEASVFRIEADAIREALKPLGATLQVCDAKGNPTSASGCLGQAVANGAGGIITDAVPVPFAEQAYAKAAAEKVPVVAADNVIPPPKTASFDRYFTPISDGFVLNGQLTADSIIADSGGKADILFVNDTTTPLTQAAGKAITDEFKANCSGCKVSDVEIQDTALQKVPSQVQAALVKNAEAKYVVTQFDAPSGALVVQGARQGRPGIKFAATGGAVTALKEVKDGGQLADAGTDPVSGAWANVDALLRSAAGKPAGKYDDVVLHRLFTKSNLESVNDELTMQAWAKGTWFSDGAFKNEYRKLWGVG